jgi:GWxTD domain-containing protein
MVALTCCTVLFAQSKPGNRAATPGNNRTGQILRDKVGGESKVWFEEDVRWIITDDERAAFNRLKNGEDAAHFIEQFWLRRDPTPDTIENEFKEEHYRRMLFANEQFASSAHGWKTDRGRVYIVYGPPDQIEAHSIDVDCTSTSHKGSNCTYPGETWRYRYLEGIGEQVAVDFIDTCRCGEYHMRLPDSEKDALLFVPSRKAMHDSALTTDQIPVYIGATRPPLPKFRDMEELVTSKIRVRLVPFQVQTDFLKITQQTVMLSITVSFDEIAGRSSDSDQLKPMPMNVYGRLTTMTGHIAESFERTISHAIHESRHVQLAMVPLHFGRYRLDLAVKDVNGDRVGTWTQGIRTPDYSEDKLATSSLILADCMSELGKDKQSCPSTLVGTTELIARPMQGEGDPVVFKKNENINTWMQVYNLGVDPQSHKPSATIEYSISDIEGRKEVFHSSVSTEHLEQAGEQITLRKTLPSGSLSIGKYNLNVTVNDRIAKQTVSSNAPLTVE